MNIFVVDKNPKIAAKMLCDKHVVKMIVETAQMLCTVARLRGHDAPYRATHKNHPCTKWADKTKGNWDWLIEHGIEMCEEYTRRYNRRHKTQDVIEWCRDNHHIGPQFGCLTPFAQAVPDKYKSSNPVKAYRDYYIGEKSHIAKWKNSPPIWWPQ